MTVAATMTVTAPTSARRRRRRRLERPPPFVLCDQLSFRLGLVADYSVVKNYTIWRQYDILLQIEWYGRLLRRHLLELGCISFACGACSINKVPAVYNGVVFLVF